MMKYQAVREMHHDLDVGTYTAWGIKGWQTGDRERTVIAYIPEVFLRKRDAEQFAYLCTELNISVSHIFDVVEDYLAE